VKPSVAEICAVVEPAFEHRHESRDHLLWTAMNAWASPGVVGVLMRLPNRHYVNLEDVRRTLDDMLDR